MKTFTLRLNDTEAIALGRLAALHKTSKNEVLKQILIEEYEIFDNNAEVIDDELEQLTYAGHFPFAVEAALSSGTTKYGDGELSATFPIRAAKYILNSDEAIDVEDGDYEKIEKFLEEMKDRLR